MTRPSRLLAALNPDSCGPADADLLARFAADKDAAAFELLVYRHAPLVLRVCRAVLRDRHDAEDAAQAVFLALARQARTVRGETLSGWLFRVGRRVAARAARGQPPPTTDLDPDTLPGAAPHAADPAEARLLHDELARLPETYRAPVLLCYFEGLTRAEAARRLGWPPGTVAGRLARAKERLASRLLRRGVVPSLLVVAVEAVPPGFAGVVSQAAVAYSVGSTAGLPAAVARLVNHETRRTAMSKLLKAVCVALSLSVVVVGLGTAWGSDPRAAAQPAPVQPPPAAQPAPASLKAVFGKGFVVAPVTTDLQRRLLGGTHSSRVVVFVDGFVRSVPFRDARTLDLALPELEDVKVALAGYRPSKGMSVAHVVVHHRALEAEHPEARLLEFALEWMARRAGYDPVSKPAYHVRPYSLDEYVAPLRDSVGADAKEPAVGDDQARGYQVRTPLSRVLTKSVDGVVDVRSRIDGRAGAAVSPVVEFSVLEALKGVGLLRADRNPPRSGRVIFLLDVRDRDDGTADRLQELVQRWATRAGLESGAASY